MKNKKLPEIKRYDLETLKYRLQETGEPIAGRLATLPLSHETHGITLIGYEYWGAMAMDEYVFVIDVPEKTIHFAQKEAYGGGKPFKHFEATYACALAEWQVSRLCQIIYGLRYYQLANSYDNHYTDIPLSWFTVVRNNERKTIQIAGYLPPTLYAIQATLHHFLNEIEWRENRKHRQTSVSWEEILERRFLAEVQDDRGAS